MVAMPKDMVGCIRRSIELSHIDSSSQHLHKPERRKSSQVCRLLCNGVGALCMLQPNHFATFIYRELYFCRATQLRAPIGIT